MREKNTSVTEVRIIITSALAWAVAIIRFSINKLLTAVIVAVSETLIIIFFIYFNVWAVYKEVRRNKK